MKTIALSYTAFQVNARSVEVVERHGHTVIRGRYTGYGNPVFVPFQIVRGRLPGKTVISPHVQFARVAPDVESIVAFTKMWGALLPTSTYDLRTWYSDDPEARTMTHFAFSVAAWEGLQAEFVKALHAAAGRSRGDAKTVEEYLRYGTAGDRSGIGAVYGVDAGIQLRDLKATWARVSGVNVKTISDAAAKARAAGAGIHVFEPKHPVYQGTFTARSLLEAFRLMLGADFTQKRLAVRVCKRCGLVFDLRRDNQYYCPASPGKAGCAQAKANLDHYHRVEKLKRRRRTARRKRAGRE